MVSSTKLCCHTVSELQCGTCFQNRLYSAVCSGNHARLVQVKDEKTRWLISHLVQPHQQQEMDAAMRSCLQSLLYSSWLRETGVRKVELDRDGIKVQVMLDRSMESMNPLYWAVVARGQGCLPTLAMDQLVVMPRHRQVVQYILNCLNNTPNFKATLMDGTPLIHILLTVGHIYDKHDQSVDLFNNYLTQHPDQVDQLCPWTKRSTLDVALEQGVHLQLQLQLYEMGCRARQQMEAQRMMEENYIVKPVIPTKEKDDPVKMLNGIMELNRALATWRENESEFRQQLGSSVLSYSKGDSSVEGRVVSVVKDWLQGRLARCGGRLGTKLKLSGSVGEGTKILPLDEIDLVLQVDLEVDLEATDEKVTNSWFFNRPGLVVHRELAKVSCKQPFPHLARIILKQGYPGLGEAGQELKPEVFCQYMEELIYQAVSREPVNLPKEVRVPAGKSLVERNGTLAMEERKFLERTKSGLMLNLEYEVSEGEWQELSVDLVSVLKLGMKHHDDLFMVMPGKDYQKKKFLTKEGLFSNCDGVIVKNGKWRMSFSFGEKKVIARNKELYLALKYLNKCSENHIDIPTYFLKEIFCSYMTSERGRDSESESLALSLARLIRHAETTPISSPFYCTSLGSELEKDCKSLFLRVKQEFAAEFEFLEKAAECPINWCHLAPSLETQVTYKQLLMTTLPCGLKYQLHGDYRHIYLSTSWSRYSGPDPV